MGDIWPRYLQEGKHQAARAPMLFRGFLRWCAARPEYRKVIDRDAGRAKAGRISDTRSSHAKALQSAGIDGLTIHGLRHSFSLLGEAAGAPAVPIAQVMGHRSSVTAEEYRPPSVDALRPYLEKIEAHILEQVGVKFDTAAEPGKLRVVAG